MRLPSGDHTGVLSLATLNVNRLRTFRPSSRSQISAFPLTVRPIATCRPSEDTAGAMPPPWVAIGSPTRVISRPDRSSQINCLPPPAAFERYRMGPALDADTAGTADHEKLTTATATSS